MKKEIFIYLLSLIILAIIQHPDILSSPLDRVAKLSDAVVYGMGAFHPFIFGLVGYIVILILRFGLFRPIMRVFKRDK